MSDAPQATTQTPQDDGLPWVRRMWARTRLAHEGVMLDRIQRTQRISEAVARNAMTGDMTNTTGFPNDSEGGGVGVDIGDSVVHNHYYAEPEQIDPPPPDPPPPEKKQMGLLAKAAIVTVLVAGGTGLGAAAVGLLSQREPPATDNDTKYEGGIRIE